MSWVRYDDGFYSHPKVGAILADDPAALALHVLANTWSCQQRRPGFVPIHQPGLLVGSKTKGKKWAALLEQHGLWDAVEGGWEFHDHAVYRESGKRSTPGTPADLSEKRAEAGRKGGKAAQQKRQAGKQPSQQNEQVAAEAEALVDSPVLSTPNGALSPEPVPVPTTSGVARAEHAAEDAGAVVKAYVDGATSAGHPRPGQPLRGRVGKDAKRLLTLEHIPFDQLLSAAYRMGERGWDSLDRELQRSSAESRGAGQPSGNMAAHLALVQQMEAAEQNGHYPGEIGA